MQMAAIINLPWNRCTRAENLFSFFFTFFLQCSLKCYCFICSQGFERRAGRLLFASLCYIDLISPSRRTRLDSGQVCVVYVSEGKVWPERLRRRPAVCHPDRQIDGWTDGWKIIAGKKNATCGWQFEVSKGSAWEENDFQLGRVNRIITVNLETWTWSFFIFVTRAFNRPLSVLLMYVYEHSR